MMENPNTEALTQVLGMMLEELPDVRDRIAARLEGDENPPGRLHAPLRTIFSLAGLRRPLRLPPDPQPI